ncbi:MAG: hydrogenase [Deltaproteobacteria bacterium RIFCSPLOWO2_02_FULL_50_16]|nr:MAG: hydrogenase [Deltaproteobacteria bacterium RIFCSPHIGHO2_02_FULL_50_15]OGQ55550.1 MAG: hydrogenase [Deltaproteobacteria bacterium RIFCSPLOWO2_02_FULL_50_16]
MWDILKNRWRQGYRTQTFPPRGSLPPPFRGRPAMDSRKCADDCRRCAEVCPTDAISTDPLRIDLGRCLFCQECVRVCSGGAIAFSQDYRLATRCEKDLVLEGDKMRLAQALEKKRLRLFKCSLKLRVVCAGGCNGCDLELQALNNVVFDLSRFGIQFVASPRHADGLIITGPVTVNMKLALAKTYEAVPDPKIVIAVGACAISGGPFEGSDKVLNGAHSVAPVDLFIAGCPPHPLTILDGLLRLLGRMKEG